MIPLVSITASYVYCKGLQAIMKLVVVSFSGAQDAISKTISSVWQLPTIPNLYVYPLFSKIASNAGGSNLS